MDVMTGLQPGACKSRARSRSDGTEKGRIGSERGRRLELAVGVLDVARKLFGLLAVVVACKSRWRYQSATKRRLKAYHGPPTLEGVADTLDARSRDGRHVDVGNIAVVGVDTCKELHVGSGDVL